MMDRNQIQSKVGAWRAEIVKAIRATQDGKRTFFDTADFPWIATLEHHWPAIRDEYDRLEHHLNLLPGIEEISKVQEVVSTDKRWKIFPLFAYGYENRKNQLRCPKTTAAVRQIPGVRAALFSILQPLKEIPPHEGAYCGVLRYHLGVKVPQPASSCGISVGGQIAHWAEGRSLVFDDTHTHFAWNRTDDVRAVLLVDFPRPLQQRLGLINEKVIDQMAHILVEDTDTQWEAWERRFGDQLDAALGIGSSLGSERE